MKLIKNLTERLETHNRYVNNQRVNALISECFAASVKDYIDQFDVLINPGGICEITTHDSLYFISPDHAIRAGELPFATTTIEEEGCAIPCFQQGLTVQGIYEDLGRLSNLIGELGYYEPNKGTWHQLFDHMGLRRATHWMEIYEALKRRSIVTLLVDNSSYEANTVTEGRNWVNIVGADGNSFYVDDPAIGRTCLDAYGLLKSIVFAWIW